MAKNITSSYILQEDELKNCFKVYAGPGAGKTYFLVQNVKNIVQTNHLISNSNLRKVLCITYTNAAVGEIKDRLFDSSKFIEVSTIHGFVIEHIIKPFQEDLISLMKSDFEIDVNNEGLPITSQIEGLGILHGINKEDIFEFVERESGEKCIDYSKKVMGDLGVDISSFDRNNPSKTKIKNAKKIKENHVKEIKKYVWSVVRKLTHDEILYFGYRIIQTNPTALYTLRVKFPFVFVDEFQDTNPMQTLLIKLIGEKSTIVGVVGDIAQSIYSFQGAKPKDFSSFRIEQTSNEEYAIDNNRRSTQSIVNFCNFLRKSDDSITQQCVRIDAEEKSVKFFIGNSSNVRQKLSDYIAEGAVVLTRTWAAAFDYIQDVEPEQAKLLKTIYNSYFNTPISIRDEIVTNNNVTWVRAFRFVFMLWNGYNSGSLYDMISAITLYTTIDRSKLSVKAIFQLDKIARNMFSTIESTSLMCDVIQKFNDDLLNDEYSELRYFLGNEFSGIPIFDEQEQDKLKAAVDALYWDTSNRLFTEVFSENSKYMTIHQSKGLEWDKVIVAAVPSKKDNITLSEMFEKPSLINEDSASEFVRMFYVACSRAREELVIHLEDNGLEPVIEKSLCEYSKTTGQSVKFEFIR
ncbi:MAG: UvrD-helicase domain-containing protein [Ruminococcus sp.]